MSQFSTPAEHFDFNNLFEESKNLVSLLSKMNETDVIEHDEQSIKTFRADINDLVNKINRFQARYEHTV